MEVEKDGNGEEHWRRRRGMKKRRRQLRTTAMMWRGNEMREMTRRGGGRWIWYGWNG